MASTKDNHIDVIERIVDDQILFSPCAFLTLWKITESYM